MFSRTYGVELETIMPRGMSHAILAAAITEAGVRCSSIEPTGFSSMRHVVVRDHWKIVYDGSVTAPSAEIVSPPLSGPEGLEQVRIVCGVLSAKGMRVDSTCGVHVHVDASRLSMAAMRKVVALYAKHEPTIDTFMPQSRRGDSNRWCRTVSDTALDRVARAGDVRGIHSVLDRRGLGKYYKLNLTSYWRYNTVEFRHHSGTIDFDKVSHWIKLCLRLIDSANRDPSFPQMTTVDPARRRPVRSGSKRALIEALLRRPEGCTQAEVLQVTGWPSVSMPSQAAALGIALRTVRRGRVCRYYASTEPLAPVTVPVMERSSFDGLMVELGMPDDEKDFWARRAADLRVPRPVTAPPAMAAAASA